MISSEQIQSSNPIQFRTEEIQDSLKKKGIYIKDTFIIKQLTDFDQYRQEKEYVPAEEDYVFAFQNNDENFPFLGVVNYYFEREGYCLNTYQNGDIYFGYYRKDKRNGQGIYSFKPIKKENSLLSQFYYGLWENDLYNGKGIYLWLNEEENKIAFSDYDNSNFEVFCGDFNKGKFNKGALLSKKGNNYFIYFGEFSEEGKKEGNKCFYYSANLETLCFGTFKNDIFIEGYVGKFCQKGELNDLIIYKKVEGKKAESEKVKLKNEPKVVKILIKIRDILNKKNYFNMIYSEFSKILKFRDERMNNIDILLSEDYEKIISCFKLNKLSLYEDIEKNLSL